jgi:hypothetical protein
MCKKEKCNKSGQLETMQCLKFIHMWDRMILNMKPKDPIWNFYQIDEDSNKLTTRCKDCNATVSTKGKKWNKKLIKKKESTLEKKTNKKQPVVVFKPPDEYPWQGRNSFLYYKNILCNKYEYTILFD